jgi:hypothetical protein
MPDIDRRDRSPQNLILAVEQRCLIVRVDPNPDAIVAPGDAGTRNNLGYGNIVTELRNGKAKHVDSRSDRRKRIGIRR